MAPYRDYISWLSRQDAGAAEAYRRDALRGYYAPTRLGLVEQRTVGATPQRPAVTQPLTRAETVALRARAAQWQVTVNTLVQGAWAVLLARYSGTRDVVFGGAPSLDEASLARVREAGPQFFRAAAEAAATGGKLDAIVNAVKAATGAKGQALWKPLRLALTGAPEGPELAPLLHAMPDSAIHDRLNRFAA